MKYGPHENSPGQQFQNRTICQTFKSLTLQGYVHLMRGMPPFDTDRWFSHIMKFTFLGDSLWFYIPQRSIL